MSSVGAVDLTEEQKAKIPGYVDKWLAIARDNSRVVYEDVIPWVNECYKCIKVDQPDYYLLYESPFSAAYGSAILQNWMTIQAFRAHEEWLQTVFPAVFNRTSVQAFANVLIKDRQPVDEFDVSLALGENFYRALEKTTYPAVPEPLPTVKMSEKDATEAGEKIAADYLKKFGEAEVFNVLTPSRLAMRDVLDTSLYGRHEAGWLSFCDFISQELNYEDEHKLLKPLIELSKRVCWWSPYSKICFLQHPPIELHVSDSGQLSNESGPVFRYADGFKAYMIDGVMLDEQIVMRPETQTIQQIDKETVEDVKAIRIERFGWPRYIKEAGAELIDERERNPISGTPEQLYKMADGSKRLVCGCVTAKVPCLSLPPHIKTCVEAQNYMSPFNAADMNLIAAT